MILNISELSLSIIDIDSAELAVHSSLFIPCRLYLLGYLSTLSGLFVINFACKIRLDILVLNDVMGKSNLVKICF